MGSVDGVVTLMAECSNFSIGLYTLSSLSLSRARMHSLPLDLSSSLALPSFCLSFPDPSDSRSVPGVLQFVPRLLFFLSVFFFFFLPRPGSVTVVFPEPSLCVALSKLTVISHWVL